MPTATRPLYIILTLALFLLTACSDGSDRRPVNDEPLTEPAEAADAFGPWAVGHRRSEAIDATRGNRVLPYDIWYPVDAADAEDEPRTVYPLAAGFGLTAARAVEDLPVSRELSKLPSWGGGRLSLIALRHLL